jgi:hypothetical protein
MMWENLDPKRTDSADYSIMRPLDGRDGLAALRAMFPDGEADEMNAVLFSTSGVHGTYNLIEEAEANVLHGDQEHGDDVTFVVVQPRLVALRYGTCEPKTAEDFAFLRKLRASSHKAFASIGLPHASQDAKADALDAARYRWLRLNADITLDRPSRFTTDTGQSIVVRAIARDEHDRAIDAGMAANPMCRGES